MSAEKILRTDIGWQGQKDQHFGSSSGRAEMPVRSVGDVLKHSGNSFLMVLLAQ